MVKNKHLKCGLIGNPLGHSYSPRIHAQLVEYLPKDYDYSLFPMEEAEVGEFLRRRDFDGINVTIPYKKTVMPFLDEISPEAQRIGSVNTIIRTDDGKIHGFNTDYYGFSYMLDKGGISLDGKKVMILGSGGASMTARTVAADRGAREIVIVSRKGEDNYGNLERHYDADVIINTTPVGMYPKNGVSPLDGTPLEKFAKLSGVVDMIFNPSKTALILDAEEAGVRCVSGLPMLVAQAKQASEIFTGEKIDEAVIDKITAQIEFDTKNIVLVGMPGVGKTSNGGKIAKKLNRKFIDLDEEVERVSGRRIPEIFEADGEEYFRNLESRVLEDAAKESALVISCGGGAVLKKSNRRSLKQNGTVVFMKRDLDSLPKSGRPLSQKNDLRQMYEARLPYYTDAADVVYEMNGSPEENSSRIIDILKSQLN